MTKEHKNILIYNPNKEKVSWTQINWPVILGAFTVLGTVAFIASQVHLR